MCDEVVKLLRMRFPPIGLLCLLSGCFSLADRLDHGYRIVHHTEDMRGASGQFAGVLDCRDLYYHQLRLGKDVSFYSVSPSGRFVLFDQDDADGLKDKLMLFDQQTARVHEVADAQEVPRSCRWRESVGILDVCYLAVGDTSHIRLEQ